MPQRGRGDCRSVQRQRAAGNCAAERKRVSMAKSACIVDSTRTRAEPMSHRSREEPRDVLGGATLPELLILSLATRPPSSAGAHRPRDAPVAQRIFFPLFHYKFKYVMTRCGHSVIEIRFSKNRYRSVPSKNRYRGNSRFLYFRFGSGIYRKIPN